MSKCDRCPISGSRCYGEQQPWACKTADRGESSRRMLAELGNAKPRVEPKPAYPPLARQAASAVASAVRFVADGFATVSQEEFNHRRAICEACPTRRYVADEDRCEACGCYLSIKPWSKVESCPDGHW